MTEPLLSVRNLAVHFPLRGHRTVHAVDGVSFDIPEGETLGLVGESGCGKTTLGRAILRLREADVRRGAVPKSALDGRHARFPPAHANDLSGPLRVLNPRMRVGSIIAEPIRALGLARNGNARPRVEQLMESGGLESSASRRGIRMSSREASGRESESRGRWRPSRIS